jgi:hypothetical protein
MHSNENIFLTERLPLAVYLHASRKLVFRRCGEGPNPGRIRFAFDDPEGVGDQRELDFENGALCSATALFASLKFLRRKMSEAQSNNSENRKNEHDNYSL